ncbi:MAG: TMEM175 family protein [Candidatus Nanopelagicales bacterium]
MSPRGTHPPDRIVAFSDGVVAIAITLLLLPLAELELPSDGRITTLIGENASLLGGLTLTWVITAIFWLAHHRLFEHVVAVDGAVLWLNFGWLFSIALLPLPTNLVIANEPSAQVTGFYVGWMTLIAAFGGAILWHVLRKPGLVDEQYRVSREARESRVRGLVIVGVFALSVVVAMVQPDIATFVLLLLFLVDPLVARIVRA